MSKQSVGSGGCRLRLVFCIVVVFFVGMWGLHTVLLGYRRTTAQRHHRRLVSQGHRSPTIRQSQAPTPPQQLVEGLVQNKGDDDDGSDVTVATSAPGGATNRGSAHTKESEAQLSRAGGWALQGLDFGAAVKEIKKPSNKPGVVMLKIGSSWVSWKRPSPRGSGLVGKAGGDGLRSHYWSARSLYLPIPQEAKEGFWRNQRKQVARLSRQPGVQRLRDGFDISTCLTETPECEFWLEIEAAVVFQKCCVEHMKMKATLFHAWDVLEKAGVELFLDSGTLLSSTRDNGTLVPWETDIDLGMVGVKPSLVADPMGKRPAASRLSPYNDSWPPPQPGESEKPLKFYYERCRTKVSKNVSRNGMCIDAHYVFYVGDEAQSKIDTSRVEVWPFWPDGHMLLHPTRQKLHVPRESALPLLAKYSERLKQRDAATNGDDSVGDRKPRRQNLRLAQRCVMWGREFTCPKDPSWYLDHEYGPTWRRPKTIHWGKENIQSWNS